MYNNFCGFLSMLNATLPPVGIILVADYFMHKEKYVEDSKSELSMVNWGAVVGVIAGAVFANTVSFGVASINAMVIAVICYIIGDKL